VLQQLAVPARDKVFERGQRRAAEIERELFHYGKIACPGQRQPPSHALLPKEEGNIEHILA